MDDGNPVAKAFVGSNPTPRTNHFCRFFFLGFVSCSSLSIFGSISSSKCLSRISFSIFTISLSSGVRYSRIMLLSVVSGCCDGLTPTSISSSALASPKSFIASSCFMFFFCSKNSRNSLREIFFLPNV